MGNGGGRAILLVEEPGASSCVAERLGRNSFRIGIAPDAFEATRVVERDPTVELVLLDLDLLGKHDYADVAKLAARVPLAFLVGTAPQETITRSECISSRGYVSKNCSEALFCASLRRMFVPNVAGRHAGEECVRERQTQLLAIFDGLEELVYVVDIGTHTMLFANRKTREVYGPDIVGTPCYRTLQGREDVCPFCTDAQIVANPGVPLRVEMENALSGGYYSMTATCIPWTDGRLVRLVLAVDTTERKRMENDLRRSRESLAEALRERNAALQELQHRIKNSLALITSLVRLEAHRAAHPAVAESLGVVGNRIASLAVLYDALYGTENIRDVNLGHYLRRLCVSLLGSYGAGDGRIVLSVSGEDDVSFDAKRAVSVGLMVNELVTNAVKHAFPGRRKGKIMLRTARLGASVLVEVADDGVGFARDDARKGSAELLREGFPSGSGTGLRLLDLLAKQLDGQVEHVPGLPGKGTCFRIVLPGTDVSGEAAREERDRGGVSAPPGAAAGGTERGKSTD